ncbi:MAG: hypothetical protein ABW161_01140 [Candidatus Thiodiazotropha sp.]
MPHPLIDQSVSISLTDSVPSVDYLLVGRLTQSSFRGVYRLTGGYALKQSALKQWVAKPRAIRPDDYTELGEVCIERAVVGLVTRADLLHRRLKAVSADNKKRDKKEQGDESHPVFKEDQSDGSAASDRGI